MEEENYGGDALTNKLTLTDKMRENPWMFSSMVLGVITLILLFNSFSGFGLTGNVISSDNAGEKLLAYYSANGAEGLELSNVEEQNGLYKVNFKYQGAIVPIYMTKDGSMAGSMTPLVAKQDTTETTSSTEIVKSDKPKVELFIMTHCPYGTQAEKGFLPAVKALGGSVDAKIRFVHYFMHGDEEEAETYTQICIREEQSTKFYDYLECFLEDSDSARCLTKVGINKANLDICVKDKAKDYYADDSDLSNKYGVQGSPTLVVNEALADSGRSPAALLSTICSAFNTPATACSQNLSSSSPSPGFGSSAASSSDTASCN